MSLSFVASAVQTGTADGGYEEKAIESKETDAVNRRNAAGSRPLFEQLRQNQEEEQAKQDELQRQMLRGTCALDEEDVAHLDALHKQKQEREQEKERRTMNEVALFRAARAERMTKVVPEEKDETKEDTKKSEQKKKPKPAIKPKIVVKKRKAQPQLNDGKPNESKSKDDVIESKKQKKDIIEERKDEKKEENKPSILSLANQSPANLGGLLSGYGSSSDESE